MGRAGHLAAPRRPHLRSLLFVPGNRLAWMRKALAVGPDGIVLDLEDSTPLADKGEARDHVSQYLRGCEEPAVPIFVRINGLTRLAALDDLRAVVCAAVTGIVVPKVESAADIAVVDRILAWLEAEGDSQPGGACIVPVLETALGIRNAFEIASSSARVAYMGGLGVKGGDVERSLGYRWSPGGTESLMLRSQVLLDARAARVANPISGLWSDVGDLDGLRRFAEQNRGLGYEGMYAIHPSHVSVINEVFTPSVAELQHDAELVAAIESASSRGEGATTFGGHMVDEAMAATARARLSKFHDSVRMPSLDD